MENINGSATSWISHPVTSDLAGAWGAVCADIDEDGDQDIFGSAMSADIVVWWENTDGAGTVWIEHSIDSSFDGAKAIIALDINQDRHIDVAGAAKVDNQVAWYSNDSPGTSWTKTVIVSDYSGANSVYPYDFDEDGDWDILSGTRSAPIANGSRTAGWDAGCRHLPRPGILWQEIQYPAGYGRKDTGNIFGSWQS